MGVDAVASLERAAYALRLADNCDFHDAENKDYPGMVRAVLQAIREPSEGMVVVMRDELPLVDDPHHVSDGEFVEYWQAMIDAALAESP